METFAATDTRARIPTDYLRCAVPVACGGLGGDARELSALISQLWVQSPSAALMFWGQRMAIEFLVQASNVALREHLLPDLLRFHRSATVPFNYENLSLRASNDGRSVFLSGGNYLAANAPQHGFSLICPVEDEGKPLGWCVLGSEEQGFNTSPHLIAPYADAACSASIALDKVFFRGDELLDEDALRFAVLDVQSALGAMYDHLLKMHEPI